MSSSSRVDIEGLHKGAVLAALFNSSPPHGFGRMQGLTIGDPIGPIQGDELYRERGPSFGVLGGRLLHVDLSGSSFDAKKYDQLVGAGAAEAVIQPLREAGSAAWNFCETFEDGMEGIPFARTEAPGALRNGTTVVKINTGFNEDDPLGPADEDHLEGTGAFDGDRGVILGSSLSVWGTNGVPMTPEIHYYVEWGHELKVVYGVLACCIAVARNQPQACD